MRTSNNTNSSYNSGSNNVLEDELGKGSSLLNESSSSFSDDDFIKNVLGEDYSEPVFQPKEEALDKPKTSRIVGATFMGIFISAILCVLVYGLYMNYIKYPAKQEVDVSKTGLYCLQNWEKSISSLESLGEDSYIAKETVYANGNEDKISFYKKIMGTVSYTPEIVTAKNVFGNDLIDRKTDEVVTEESTISEGEEVTLSYIDYTKVKINEGKVKELMTTNELALGDVDYNNKLVDVFCQYMNSLSIDDLPLKEVAYIPNIVQSPDGEYSVQPEEDIYLDKLLLSSSEFYDLIDRFSVVAGEVSAGVTIQPTEEWNNWNALSKKEKEATKEPSKYNYKEVADKTWCGVYYLQNEYTTLDSNGNVISESISAEIGDGTQANPAGLDTGVVTVYYVDEQQEDGSIVSVPYPIRVTLVEYGVSKDAIKWAEDKDTKNRGIDISSEVQYCYYVFQVTNLSDKALVINDNSALCDTNANLAPKTGTLYGLASTVTLQPDETGIIESWNSSTELNKKYLIWGADFARRTNPVWFRVLAGNIGDPSEDKGVTINKTRKDE